MNGTVLVFEGGGMRNAFVSGVLETLQSFGLRADIAEAVYACSSAAPTAAYYVAGQAEIAPEVWIDRLTSPEVFDLSRARRREPLGDIDLVIDRACADLDIDALTRASPGFYVNTVAERDGTIRYHDVRSGPARPLLKATCALPGIARPVHIGNERMYDGGIGDPLPVARAIEDGHRRIIVFSNRPRGFRIPVWERTVPAFAIGRRCALLRTFLMRAPAYDRIRAFIEDPDPRRGTDILLVAPEDDIDCSMFCRDKRLVAAAVAKGRAHARTHLAAIERFLS